MTETYQSTPSGASAPAGVPVPEQVTIALAEIVESAQEGLLALAVGAGLQVMQALMADSVSQVCGPPGQHNPDCRYNPTTSRTFASSSGSVENLNVSTRHGCSFHFRQIRATVAKETPRWVASSRG